jgi:hypothetical protein
MQIFWPLNIALTAYALLSAAAAAAADITAYAADANRPSIIVIDGDPKVGDQKRFIDAALANSSSIVVLNSWGGSLVAGIEIGKAIRLKGMRTFVPSNALCASACALAWLGGTGRLMSAGAKIGFHAASSRHDGGVTATGNALMGAYLSQIGLPESVVVYISEPGPDQLRWLTLEDARAVGIEVTRVETPGNSPGTSLKVELKAELAAMKALIAAANVEQASLTAPATQPAPAPSPSRVAADKEPSPPAPSSDTSAPKSVPQPNEIAWPTKKTYQSSGAEITETRQATPEGTGCRNQSRVGGPERPSVPLWKLRPALIEVVRQREPLQGNDAAAETGAQPRPCNTDRSG